ncbi:DUF6443 domain-containing protein [Pedobacter heparinus]|uniref:DUF6443 domain-containing protein n=1 Tax=Pedobacter heparinus TaxID=984 RepID=UPI00292EC370|nr:DUF6443 domain-containing protein [Pedobacter heparinus]
MKKYSFQLALLLLATYSVKAQHILLDQPQTTGLHTATGSIRLMPGFSTGNSFQAYVMNWAPNCTALNVSPNTNQNYIISYTPNNPFTSSSGFPTAGACDVQADIAYYDGLGRPLQTVQVKGSPLADNDIVTPVVYDNYGREVKKYLSYASASNDGSYKTTALTDVISYYGSPTPAPGQHQTFSTPFAETKLESSPSSRPLEQGAPGASWQLGGGHTILASYGANSTGEVPLWTVSGTGAVTTGAYMANQLYRTETTDENGNKSIIYKDKNDKVLVKKIQESVSSYLSTHYIYDEFGNLRFVLPPAVSPVSFDETSTSFNQFIYAYQYDSRNRMVKKKIPGKGWESMVYDTHDRLVATQDAIQAVSSFWTFTKYDKFGRIIQTGEVTDGRSAAALAGYVAGFNPNFETASSTDPEGYTRNAWPQSWNKLYTVNYYDGYSFPGHPGTSYNATATGVSSSVNGLLTASRARNLDTGDMYWTVNHYDQKGQVREVIAQNHMSGIDRTINDYNFTGQVTKASRNHSSSTVSSLPIITSYAYDHRGRKVETSQQINGGTEVLLSKLEYAPTGQLITKRLHNQMQTTDYTYNERGWLKTSNAPEFSMELKYQDALNSVAAQYNGNIANQVYTNAGVSSTFNYNYDNLNRLTRGEISPSVKSEALSYDVMGNISSLNRDNTGANSYAYWNGGNQLRSIANVTVADYQYDANGNATTDGRKGVTIGYNTLNLPSTVTGVGLSMTYTYDATGTKLRKVSNMEATSDYVDGIQYTGGVIEFIMTEEGKARRNNGTPDNYSYEYNLTDHLGNVRYTFNQHPSLGTLQELQTDNYYPFGKRFADGGVNKYLYNGKELQSELGQLDYGARFYDPEIGRWNVVDPSSEEGDQESLTQYQYGMNNPVRYDDPDGRCPTCITGAIGAVAGGLIGGLIEGGSQLYNSGRITSWKAVGGSALQGAITGGVAGLTGGTSLLASVGANAGANIVGGAVNRAVQGQGTTLKDVAIDGAIGGGFAAAGKAAGALVENGLNKLSNQAKGALGEAVTKAKYGASGYVSNGEAVVATGRKTATGLEQVAKYDHNMKNIFTGKQLTVESKFNTSGLTSNQRAALKNVTTPGGAIVNRTTSQQLGKTAQRVVTGTGGQVKRN